MTKIVGVVGSGMVGRDPWDPNCWSRSGFNLFTKLKEVGALDRAIGVEVPLALRAPIMLKNFSRERRRWRQKFNLDPQYYEMLTNEITKVHRINPFPSDASILQIGGHYNAAKATGLPSYSYHDGNIAGLMNSPFFKEDLRAHALQAFEFEKATYKDLNKIFVMSEYWKNSFITNFSIPEHKVVNVGFGVNIPDPEPFIKDFSLKNVVFIGIDFSRKGGEYLVKAFNQVKGLQRHKDATLHIIGPKEKPSILDRFPDGVQFHGHLSREVAGQRMILEEVLQTGTIFVLPSLYEPFGNAALEAMLYRMPVITTNDWSFPDFVMPGETGALLTNPQDVDEIAAIIVEALDNIEEYKIMGTRGHHMVKKRYSWNATVEKIIEEIG